eukprot:190090_1
MGNELLLQQHLEQTYGIGLSPCCGADSYYDELMQSDERQQLNIQSSETNQNSVTKSHPTIIKPLYDSSCISLHKQPIDPTDSSSFGSSDDSYVSSSERTSTECHHRSASQPQLNNTESNKKPALHQSYSTSDISRLRSNTSPCKIDRYGFPLTTDDDDTTPTNKPKRTRKNKKRNHHSKKDTQRAAARKEKALLVQWQNLLFPSSTSKQTKINWTDLQKKSIVNYKIRSLIKNGGIPQPLRSFVWSNVCAVNDTRNKPQNKGLYERLLAQNKKEKNKYDRIIWKDIHRTFRGNLKYGAVGMGGTKEISMDDEDLLTESHKTLYNVLSAFSIYNEDIGYCQGMQAISALLLMYMIEEDVFFVLNTIARSDKYGKLCTCWNMQGIQLRFAQFEYCFKEFLPKLYKHLSRHNITNVSMFGATAWFVTIFISSQNIGFDLIVRIWDVYLCRGIETVFKFGIGLFKYLKKRLLKMNSFEMLMKTLNDGFKIIADNHDNEKYIKMSLSVKIKQKQIEKWTKQYHKLNPIQSQ